MDNGNNTVSDTSSAVPSTITIDLIPAIMHDMAEDRAAREHNLRKYPNLMARIDRLTNRSGASRNA